MTDAATPVRDIYQQDDCVVVTVVGDIDMAMTKTFQASLADVVAKKPSRIVVDLAGVGYMDSSGVASLVKLHTQTKKIGATMALAQVNPRVMSIFQIMRLDQLFGIFATIDEATAGNA